MAAATVDKVRRFYGNETDRAVKAGGNRPWDCGMLFKYLAYVAIICAVLLDLFSAKPGTSVIAHAILNTAALVFACGGLAGLAMASARIRKSRHT